jgi:hypothetical protein
MFGTTTTYDPALAELGAALKVSAVPAGLTEIRREWSGEAYYERGRVTARLAPAKAAANRAGRRAAREALRRAINGDVDNAGRRAGKQHFAYRHGTDPGLIRSRELRGEHYRRFTQRVDAWREEVEVWEAEYARVRPQSYLTAYLWMSDHPRPTYPNYVSFEA